jgi:predicted phage terminase large subunit-like protein
VTIWHPQDPGSAGKDSAQDTNIKLAQAGFEAHFEPVTGDKTVRAGPWSSACEAGRVRLVRGGWNEAFVEEHIAFPMGRLKDQVDAADGAYSKISGELVLDGQLLF